MTPLACADVEGRIDLYARGECEPAAADEVGHHLARCLACARAYQDARRLGAILDLHWRQGLVLARLGAALATERRARWRLSAAARRGLALAALLLALLVLAWLALPR